MEKEEIKKQIDDAVRIFRETLKETYLKGKKGKLEFYGIGVHSFLNIFQGNINLTRKNNGNLKVSGEIGKQAFNEKCKGLPNSFDDWNIYPLIITLFNKDIGDKESKKESKK